MVYRETIQTWFPEMEIRKLRVRTSYGPRLHGARDCQVKVSFKQGGQTYVHAFDHGVQIKGKKIDLSPGYGFFQVFNKLLNDQESQTRLWLVRRPRPEGKVPSVTLCKLRQVQAGMFTLGRETVLQKEQPILGPVRINEALEFFEGVKLLPDLNKKTRKSCLQDDFAYYVEILAKFPGKVAWSSLDDIQFGDDYAAILEDLQLISNGEFQPENLQDSLISKGNQVEAHVLSFDLQGEKFSKKIQYIDPHYDKGFWRFLRSSCIEAGLAGNFYILSRRDPYEVGMIYLRPEQKEALESFLGEKLK